MNKKGFTFVELLGVLVVLAIVSLLGTVSISAIVNGIKEGMLETKIESIEESAIYWGQENMNELNETCTVSEEEYKFCKLVTVQFLLDEGAMTSEETDDTGKTIVKNQVTNNSMSDDTVQIYKKNNRVYAIMKEIKSNS